MPTILPTPPFHVVARALQDATERLAAELRAPTEVAPDWNEFEWNVASAVATLHGISALLFRSLKWRGPEKWQSFLREQCAQSLQRERRIDAFLPRIDAAMRRENVAVVLLKGAAIRALGIYQPGDRAMGDLDLLARHADFPAVSRALRSVGYQEAFATKRNAVFTDMELQKRSGFGEHIDNPLIIELHPTLYDPLPSTDIDITARVMPGALPAGANAYPDLAALLAHLLLRAANNMCSHALRLSQLQDIARLTPRVHAPDWQHLLTAQSAAPWWALPPLLLAQRYCDAPVPLEVLARLSDACPRLLARAARRFTLTEVSWSNLRIAAFPGLVWSTSIGEAVRYARSRLLPDREALVELAHSVSRTPQFAAVPWYGLPHAARIARWLFGRPPRVQAINAVMDAVATGEQTS
jgi:hypothetical protein